MNAPEPVNHVSSIVQLLGCPAEDALRVLELAQLDPLWEYRDVPGYFRRIILSQWKRLKRESGGSKS